jgi:uncharacterized protein (TIGR03067 family)
MRTTWLLLLLAPGLLGADAPANDQKHLQGTWKVLTANKDGKPLPAELVKNLKLTFRGEKFILRVADETREGTFTLQPAKKPKAITVTHADGKTKPSEGIYAFDKGRLSLCFAEPGQDRPTGFEPKDGAKCELYILERDKP